MEDREMKISIDSEPLIEFSIVHKPLDQGTHSLHLVFNGRESKADIYITGAQFAPPVAKDGCAPDK